MPFFQTLSGQFGYGRAQAQVSQPATGLPTYYTSASGYFMYQPGFNLSTLILKQANFISTNSNIRTYNPMSPAAWTYIHDKDLDSNVWYGMPEGTRVLWKNWLTKGGTTVSTNTLFTYGGATTSVLGACYAPACMWETTVGFGAFIIGGFNQAVVHVIEFNAAKTNSTFTYTVPYVSEVYGTEVIPRQASGFTNHFGIAYTRGSKQMASWSVDMSTRSWTNRKDNSYTSGTNGPNNGDGMIYYPPGKPIFTNDPDTTTNRIAMNDTSSSNLYVWNVTQSTVALNWTYLKTIPMINNGGYPYHMSQRTYDSVS
jgi:hypothetical protein